MYKTLFKCFLVYYEHVFVYCNVFAATISFSMYLLSILSRFHTLIYFYLLSVFYWVQKKPPEVSYKKMCPLKLRNIFRKTPVLGLFLIKLWAFRTANILKRDSNTGVSCEICENILKNLSWKTSANVCFSKWLARMG